MTPELFLVSNKDGSFVHSASRASDVFALAVTVYCVLAARASPFPPSYAEGMIVRPRFRVPKGLRPELKDLPEGVPEAVRCMLEDG